MAARIERVEDPIHGAGSSCGTHPDPEGKGAHPVGVDAEQERRARVLDRRAHRSTESRAREQQVEKNENRNAESERIRAHDGHLVAEDGPGGVRVAGVRSAVGRLVDGAEHTLDAERERPRDQE